MEHLKEFKRQVEIVAIVYEYPSRYSEFDLIDRFKVSQATIRRDFIILKKMGVDIRSRKRKVILDLNLKTMNSLLSSYISINAQNNIKNLKQIRKSLKNKTISLFVSILKAINERRYIRIQYVQNENDIPELREIIPFYLNSTNRSFHVIAYENNQLNFFRIEGIKSIILTSSKFQGDIPDINDIYRNSWGVYSGGEEIIAKLKFNKKWESHFEQKIHIEGIEITRDKDSIIVKIPVKLSFEFIMWVMGWGKEVIVIEPENLQQEVLTRANGLIDNHKVNKSVVN